MEKDELVENYLKNHGLELMCINDIIPLLDSYETHMRTNQLFRATLSSF